MQTRFNSKGFTLIELMIVVAIIGILVSLAIPKFEVYQAKSRQAEAKLVLSGIYNLEKSFYAEYSSYVPAFDAIGYTPEGRKRFYHAGWRGAAWALTVTGYSGATATQGYTAINYPATWTNCAFATMSGAVVGSTGIAPNTANDPQTLLVGAWGQIRNGQQCDAWTITDTKLLSNVQSGL